MHGDDPECAAELKDVTYCAGNRAFAEDVIEVLKMVTGDLLPMVEFLNAIKRYQDRDTRHACAEAAMQEVKKTNIDEALSFDGLDTLSNRVHSVCMNVNVRGVKEV